MIRGSDGRVVYAVGDVHGRYDLLKALLQSIADDGASLSGPATLVMLGDYVDRGPESAEVLAALVWLQRQSGFDVHLLRGNHEEMMLDFLAAPEDGEAWLANGGDETLRSYGVEPPSKKADDEALTEARDRLLDAMPASHLALLRETELRLAIGDHLFVHAGIRPGIAIDRQSPRDLLWIRAPFLDGGVSLGPRVVHGHSWTGPEPHVDPRRIGVDTGAWTTGVLTAARIEGASLRFLRAVGAPAPRLETVRA